MDYQKVRIYKINKIFTLKFKLNKILIFSTLNLLKIFFEFRNENTH